MFWYLVIGSLIAAIATYIAINKNWVKNQEEDFLVYIMIGLFSLFWPIFLPIVVLGLPMYLVVKKYGKKQ